MPRYLQKRRRVWYAVLEIPKSLRPKFRGKPRFVKSLQTESQTEAERLVLGVVATWKTLLEAQRNGLPSEDAIKALQVQAEDLRQQGWAKQEIAFYQEGLGDLFEDDGLREAAAAIHGCETTLALHIDEYVAKTDGTPKTKDMKAADVRRFAERFPYSGDVTRLAVIDWVEKDLMTEAGLSGATARRIISACRGYWAYLERHHGMDTPEPFEKVVPSAPRKKTKKDVQGRRKHFTPYDYQRLLQASQRRSQALSALIQLGAHTGARIEELCSLKLENVSEDRFEIEDAKTSAGIREIPIHQHIIKLVAQLKRQSTDMYLLSGLTLNKYGDRSNAIGKQFGRLKTEKGYARDYVFHSLRKGVATQLETAGVPENVTARLLGHDLKTMSYGLYSGGVTFEVLEEALGKLKWD
ncbi:tyrosine-type recombinase/integrase [Palleronia pelagia]|uniref:Site-specific recombinase XerD n=1 Tax=Palleronia pelagia TaxID=387096 RepID=A0A1H8D2C1_9RHOB|nr:tyrosine-type recombinase/integrase [Palleronia pelagia]SEN01440.1 Site-specific recombinase XerD [Palleronia pelagia]